MAEVKMLYAIIGTGPMEGIWGYDGFTLVCSDADTGLSVDDRINLLKNAAENIKARTGSNYKLCKFALIKEGN